MAKLIQRQKQDNYIYQIKQNLYVAYERKDFMNAVNYCKSLRKCNISSI